MNFLREKVLRTLGTRKTTFCMFLGLSYRSYEILHVPRTVLENVIFACSLGPSQTKFRVLMLPHGLVPKGLIYGEYKIQTCLS